MKTTKHLWEIEHPYYCEENNYFGYNGEDSETFNDTFESFDDFLLEYRDTDLDMNLVFRWDWKAIITRTEHKDGFEVVPVWKKDSTIRDGYLHIYWMMQRKGYHRTTTIKVARNEEEVIKAWLRPRYKHLLKLWSPFNE